MAVAGYFPRFESCSVAEEMIDWLNSQKEATAVKANGVWEVKVQGKTFKGEDLVHVLIEAESWTD